MRLDHRLDLNLEDQFQTICTASSLAYYSHPMRVISSPLVSLFVICLVIHSSICAERNHPSLTYQRLASLYCFIDDYPAWLEQQSILEYFLQFAQYFYIDVDLVKKALEQYRLQHECLKALERRPILIGGG